MKLFLYQLNARCNTALDTATEYLIFGIMLAACELGRAKDRVLFRCRSRAFCCWCGRTLRRRWFFWQRDNVNNITGGCCAACLEKDFPPVRLSPGCRQDSYSASPDMPPVAVTAGKLPMQSVTRNP